MPPVGVGKTERARRVFVRRRGEDGTGWFRSGAVLPTGWVRLCETEEMKHSMFWCVKRGDSRGIERRNKEFGKAISGCFAKT